MRLAKLPYDHPLRNAPLAKIGARYTNTFNEKALWRDVLPSFGIANATYNDLGRCWTDNAIWEANDFDARLGSRR